MHLLSIFLFISQKIPTGTVGADSNLCGNNRVRIYITWWYQNVKVRSLDVFAHHARIYFPIYNNYPAGNLMQKFYADINIQRFCKS